MFSARRVTRELTRHFWRRRPNVVTFGGALQIPLDDTPPLLAIAHLVRNDNYERREIDAALKLVLPEDRVLELGAGCGLLTGIVCQKLQRGSALLAYEANEDLAPSFRAIMAANGLSPQLRIAVIGQEEGFTTFFVRRDFRASSIHEQNPPGKSRIVPRHSLSRIMKEFRPSVVLIDIEGAEQQILQDPLPEFVRAVSGEFHPGIIGDAAVSQIIRGLLEQGFEMKLNLCWGNVLSFERSVASGA